jgi:hypothetical protein
MSDVLTIEERVKALEKEVAELKQRVRKPETMREWLERVSGTFENDPDFEEIVRLGREFRQADRPSDEG